MCAKPAYMVRDSNTCSRAIQWPTKETIYKWAFWHVIYAGKHTRRKQYPHCSVLSIIFIIPIVSIIPVIVVVVVDNKVVAVIMVIGIRAVVAIEGLI